MGVNEIPCRWHFLLSSGNFIDDYYSIDIEHRVASIRDRTGTTIDYILDESAADELNHLLAEYAMTVYDSKTNQYQSKVADCTMIELFEYNISFKHGSYRERSAYGYPADWEDFISRLHQLIVARSLDSGRLALKDRVFKLSLEAADKNQSRYITMKCTPAESGSEHPLTISVYRDEAETIMIQQIEATTIETYFHEVKIEDINFDGHLDFYWPRQKWSGDNWRYFYWIWDEATQGFIFDPYEMNNLTSPEFDHENKIIKSEIMADGKPVNTRYLTCMSSSEGVYLLCNRDIYYASPDSETGHRMIIINDYINGSFVEVYRQDIDAEGINAEEEYAKLSRWHDLSYHGE